MSPIRSESAPYSVKLEIPPNLRASMIFIIAVGMMIRIVLAGISDGTNDFLIWTAIATTISEKGFIEAYRSLEYLNHPPLAAVWSWVALQSGVWFSLMMKIPAIVGDALSIALLGKIWLERGDLKHARGAMLAMALSPIALIISGYHCNTDNLYAFFSLLAMYLIGMRGRFFVGGLALGAAINVKLIPVLLIPVTLSMCRNWRQAAYLAAGLAMWVIPFLPLIVLAPEAVKTNMLSYVPVVSRWGVAYILFNLWEHERFKQMADQMMQHYLVLGRWAILAFTGVVCTYSWLRPRRWNGFELATLVLAAFLVLAPGFGNQYLVVIVPMLLAIDIPRSWLYGILAGLFTLLMYWAYLVSYDLPLLTQFPASGPAPGATIGLLTWAVLVMVIVQIIQGRRQKDEG